MVPRNGSTDAIRCPGRRRSLSRSQNVLSWLALQARCVPHHGMAGRCAPWSHRSAALQVPGSRWPAWKPADGQRSLAARHGDRCPELPRLGTRQPGPRSAPCHVATPSPCLSSHQLRICHRDPYRLPLRFLGLTTPPDTNTDRKPRCDLNATNRRPRDCNPHRTCPRPAQTRISHPIR